MDLNLALTFLRVAEARSFSAAAQTLGVTTSSVSRAVVRLEAQLGAKLFERSTRRTALTSIGRAYYEHAARAVASLEEGERLVGELQGQARGEVRLTIPTDLDDGFLAAQLSAFARLHPGIRLTLTMTNRIVDLAAEGLDLALRVAEQLPDSSLVARPLGRYRAWMVASPEYLRRRPPPKRPSDLARHECILTVPGGGTARWTLIGPRGEEVVEVHGRIAADDLQFCRQLVLAGAGIGVVPFAPGSPEVSPPGLARVLRDYLIRGPGLFLVGQPMKRLALRVALLREFLVNVYAEAARDALPG